MIPKLFPIALCILSIGITDGDYFAKNPSVFSRVLKSFDRYNQNKPTPSPPILQPTDTPTNEDDIAARSMPRVLQNVQPQREEEKDREACLVLPSCDWSEGTPTAMEMILASVLTEEGAVRKACEATARELRKWTPFIDERR